MDDSYKILEDVVRYSYAGVVWSHKIHEKQADIYSKRFNTIELVKILIAALTSAGIVFIFFKDYFWIKASSTVLSFITFFIAMFYKSFNLQNLIVAHKNTASKLIAVRDRYKVLLTEIKIERAPIEDLLSKYNELLKETNNIYLVAPNTTEKAVKNASKALKVDKDNTFTDEEIDIFLPPSLRRGKPNE